MKRRIFGLLSIIVIVSVIGFLFKIISNRSPKQGELKVDSQPAASVFLEDKHIGRTPIGKTPFKVDEGEYLLKIVPDPGITELATWQEKVRIGGNALTYINVLLSESELTSSSYVLWLEKITSKKSELSVTTNPDGATVIVDGEMKGMSPLTVPDVTPGDHTVTLVSRGFNTKEIKVKFSEGYRIVTSVKMALSSGTPTPDASPSATPSVTGTGTPKVTATPVASGSAVITDVDKPYVLIKETPTGFLRVRTEASTGSAEIARVKPGEKYPYLDSKPDWLRIKVASDKTGWVSSLYSQKVE